MKSPAKEPKFNRSALLAGIAILAIVIAIVFVKLAFKPSSPGTTTGVQEPSSNAEPVGAVIAPSNTLTVSPTPAPAAAPIVTNQARDLIAGLSQLPTNSPVAPEIADAWKQRLAQLARLGVEALPEISEFLEKNLNLDFAPEIAKALGHDSIRLALLTSLFAIDSPEAMALAVRTLEN